MTLLRRRTLLAAGATVAMTAGGRKPRAQDAIRVPKLTVPRLGDLAPGERVPEIRFTLADGTPQTLASYIGQGVVLNFWATWCVPCILEMPALAKLAAIVRGEPLAVLPLSSDLGGRADVEKFYRERQIEGLPVLLDPRSAASRAFGVRGIPTTVLIDTVGREFGRFEGAADWASAEAVAAVRVLAR